MIPQEMQTDYDRYAQEMNLRRTGQLLGTPSFGTMNIEPMQRRPGFMQSVMPGIGRGLGALGGAAGGAAIGSIIPGIGTAGGALLGGLGGLL